MALIGRAFAMFFSVSLSRWFSRCFRAPALSTVWPRSIRITLLSPPVHPSLFLLSFLVVPSFLPDGVAVPFIFPSFLDLCHVISDLSGWRAPAKSAGPTDLAHPPNRRSVLLP